MDREDFDPCEGCSAVSDECGCDPADCAAYCAEEMRQAYREAWE